MRVKVCGVTQEEQLNSLADAGATFAGLIYYPKSPRYALRHITTGQIKKVNNINKVGVFVNASQEEILQMVDECRLHMVQLHGDETPRFCEKIADYISVVKAFRLSEKENISWRIQEYMHVCDMFMFDTEGVGYGGTGKKFDFNQLLQVQVGKPYFLSGGLEIADATALKEFAAQPQAKGLFAVDINSKFEYMPGIKNMDLVRQFVKELE